MGYIGTNPQSYLDFQGTGGQPTSGLELVASSVDFTSQSEIDFNIPNNSYDVFEFYFVNIHAVTDAQAFGFQFNAHGASGYNEAIISTYARAEHSEGGAHGFGYTESGDQATTDGNGTFQRLSYTNQIDDDEAFSGMLTLYDPSSTTYVKHFTATANFVHHGDHYSQQSFVGGYVNTTTNLVEIRFMMESGSIESGSIFMYGVK